MKFGALAVLYREGVVITTTYRGVCNDSSAIHILYNTI